MATTQARTFAVSALALILGGAIWIAKADNAAPPTLNPRGDAPSGANGPRYAKLSPFSAIRWRPQVRVNGTWYELVAIDDQPIQEILDFAAKTYGSNNVTRRMDEDLVEVLTRKGYPPEESVKLRLRTLDTNQSVTLENVPMTNANRDAIRAARQPGEVR